jgi:predicted homoserine dehydrogenase-like protein
MIIVDTALEKRAAANDPVKVGVVGAGYIGRGMTLQIEQHIPGMKVAAIANRTLEHAENAYRQAGINEFLHAQNASQLSDAVAAGRPVVTDDALALSAADGIDVIIEATGHVEFSAHVTEEAIAHRKHVVLMNAELDATVGPILKVHADRAGVVITNADGDQPGVMMNLLRFVRTIGYKPVLAGNIKGLQDHYRTPETQKGFAAAHGISPEMATSFADGTKISMENAIVANATGFKVGVRGMYGPECKHVNEAVSLFPLEEMLERGLVDYILGAEPGPGVFVLGYNEHPERKGYMRYFKMGEGPLYPFYVPYHLPHLEGPLTAARAVLFHDAAVVPIGAPVCDVITIAKTDLKAGEVIDGIGGFKTYGTIENIEISRTGNLLPMGLAEGCRLHNDISKDQAITYQDIQLPAERLCDRLRREQDLHFFGNEDNR